MLSKPEQPKGRIAMNIYLNSQEDSPREEFKIYPKHELSYFDIGQLLVDALLLSNALEVFSNIRTHRKIDDNEVRILQSTYDLLEGLSRAERFLTVTETHFMPQPDEVNIVNVIKERGGEEIPKSIESTQKVLKQLVESGSRPLVELKGESLVEITNFLRVIRLGIEHLIYEAEYDDSRSLQ